MEVAVKAGDLETAIAEYDTLRKPPGPLARNWPGGFGRGWKSSGSPTGDRIGDESLSGTEP